MKDVSEVLFFRSSFGRNVGVLIGTIASIYIATKGIQYISKKITDKKNIALKKLSSSAHNPNIVKNIDANSNTITEAAEPSESEINSIHQTNPFDCCSVCQNPFNIAVAGSTKTKPKIDYIVSCNHCLSQTCKSAQCAIWLQKQNRWECTNCHHFDSVVYVQAYDWIFEQLNQRFDDKAIDTNVKHIAPINEIDSQLEDDVMLKLNAESTTIPLQQRVRVREFIEDLLGSMLGGSLDNVCVGQIYKNLEYLKIFLLFHCELSTTIYKLEVSLHQALSSDLPILEHNKNPGVSYENLRKIVHTIVQEVIKLPEFYNQKGFSSVDTNQVQSSFEPKIYEDLLATAVINKIVETYNDKKYENSSGIHSGGSDLDSSCHIDQTNPSFILNSRCSSTELKSEYSAFNERFRSPSMKTADIIDEIFREKLGKENYQSSASASAHSELSDYIQNHKISLPDFEFNENVDIADEDSDEIEQEFQSIYANTTGFETNPSELSDNWLFRKVRSDNCMNGSASSIVSASSPVGMLVPSPTQNCRTLIGNQNADEISDLSENGSDVESLHAEHRENDSKRSRLNAYDLPHVLVESKTLIGGKNEVNSFEQSKATLIDLLEPGSLVSEQSLTGQSPAISEAKNNLILIEDRSSAFSAINKVDRFTTMDQSFRNEEDLNADLLIKFDSLEAYESISVEYRPKDTHILNRNEKNISNNTKHEFDQREYESFCDMNRFTDETGNERVSPKKLSTLDVNEEFSDSLEVNVTDRDSLQANDDVIKGELFDTVEQDSLETTKMDIITTNENVQQFLPFAQIGSNWSNDCAAQNSTTNQIVENDIINNKTNESNIQTNNTINTNQSDNQDYRDVPGSIAEREHMKWQNAVELPNNPYSAEALQRRLSQSSNTKFMDIERLASKCEPNIKSTQLSTNNQANADSPIKVELNSNRLDSEWYRRDYYINDSKSASGSRSLKTCGDLNRHRIIDDDDNADDNDDDNNGYSTLDIDHDTNDSLHIGNIEVVSTTHTLRTYSNRSHLENQTETLRKVQPIQVDENDPILDKAKKLDHLCTEDRDYFLLQSDTVSTEEYAKLSLGSETTDDSHVQQLSLPHCDDSLSTTVSEESECTAAVRVYDLNKRETKILRHDIIKRSRNPIGGESINSFDNFGNCCSVTNTKERNDSPLETTIQHLNSRLLDLNVSETRKPPRSPTKLKSTHLNRNPRKLKMSDVQMMNDAFGTSLDPKIIDELKRKSGETDEIDEIESINMSNDFEKNLVNATEELLKKEREASQVCTTELHEVQCQESDVKQQSDESAVFDHENTTQQQVLVNESANCENTNMQNVQNHNGDIENSCVTTEYETVELPTLNSQATSESTVSISNNQIECQVTNHERNHEVIVQVNDHKEKSVIEEEVISALPSVKALARTFSTKITETVPEKIHRPKMAWRSSSNNNDDNVKDQNGNDSSSQTFAPPNFNHSYHPMEPGYSITARSLSTKFREELKNATDEGRSSPERPSSPVLVPGILKNNVAFFENLRNK